MVPRWLVLRDVSPSSGFKLSRQLHSHGFFSRLEKVSLCALKPFQLQKTARGLAASHRHAHLKSPLLPILRTKALHMTVWTTFSETKTAVNRTTTGKLRNGSIKMPVAHCRQEGKKKKLERVQIFFSGSLGKKWRVGVGEIIYSTSKKKRKRNRTLKSHYKQWGGSLCIDMGTWEGAAGERPRFTGKWETHTEKHCGRHNSFIRAVRLQVHIRIQTDGEGRRADDRQHENA